MKNIIDDTVVISYSYLKAFGFKDEQISLLIEVGKKDLHNELSKLKVLMDADTISLEDINNVLHALKGLLFQLGNHELAEKLNEIRSNLDSKVSLEEISKLLFED